MAGKSQAKEEIEICSENMDQIVQEFSPMIKYVANRIALRLPPHIEVDDLVSVGAIGLMDAIEKYDPTRGAKFKTYAEFRVRGSILDELRSAKAWLEGNGVEIERTVDHIVSKSLYFRDPDGNQLEVFVDGDPKTWHENPARVATSEPLTL